MREKQRERERERERGREREREREIERNILHLKDRRLPSTINGILKLTY